MKRKYDRNICELRAWPSASAVPGESIFILAGAEASYPLTTQLPHSLATITIIPQTIDTHHTHAQMLNYLGK